jgi:hypothetical protein
MKIMSNYIYLTFQTKNKMDLKSDIKVIKESKSFNIFIENKNKTKYINKYKRMKRNKRRIV